MRARLPILRLVPLVHLACLIGALLALAILLQEKRWWRDGVAKLPPLVPLLSGLVEEEGGRVLAWKSARSSPTVTSRHLERGEGLTPRVLSWDAFVRSYANCFRRLRWLFRDRLCR